MRWAGMGVWRRFKQEFKQLFTLKFVGLETGCQRPQFLTTHFLIYRGKAHHDRS